MPKSYGEYINCLNKNGQPSYDRNQLLEIAGGLEKNKRHLKEKTNNRNGDDNKK